MKDKDLKELQNLLDRMLTLIELVSKRVDLVVERSEQLQKDLDAMKPVRSVLG
jgi:hypothetical protein